MSRSAELAAAGFLGVNVPAEYGGGGMGISELAIVLEELATHGCPLLLLVVSPAICATIIAHFGSDTQKQAWLPRIASGEVLPTAVFTEPNTGSDLASLKTRAERTGGVYRVHGSKTWITHPVRADLMTLLVRTNPREKGYRGLSMLLAEKPRGTDDNPFPAPGMSGSEIEVIGYRGMKEFEIGFDGFEVKAENLLVIATTGKLAALRGAPLLVDTGDAALDAARHRSYLL